MRIVFEHVSFAYPADGRAASPALRDISVELRADALTGVCGGNGSGKSTLIRLMNGIFRPTAGRVLVDGEDIHRSKAALRRVRQRIGMSFQFPERQLFGRTVWEELTHTLEEHALPAQEIAQRVTAAAEAVEFDVPRLRERSPFSLSRSEQRKLGLAVTLSLRPEVAVFDEPTAGMDRANARRFLSALRRLHESGQTQIMLVSHDLALLLDYAQRLLIMDRGAVAFCGSPQQTLEKPNLLDEAGVALPPVAQFFRLLHARDPRLAEAVKHVSSDNFSKIPLTFSREE